MLKLTIAAARPEAAAAPDICDPSVEVWRYNDGSVCAYAYHQGGDRWMHWPGLASFCLTAGDDEVHAIPDPPVRMSCIQDIFERSVRPVALQLRGWEALHASAVCMRPGVVAFCGPSGTGKSTTAFALSRRGHPIWADDAVLFHASSSGVRLIPLPFEIRLRPPTRSFFNETPSSALRAESNPTPLAAVMVLQRAGESGGGPDIEIRRLRGARALTAVLPHTYCFGWQDADRKNRMIQHYMSLTAQVPVFELRFEPALEKLPQLLNQVECTVHDLAQSHG